MPCPAERHAPPSKEAEPIGAVSITSARHTAVVAACRGIAAGAVSIDVAHHAPAGVSVADTPHSPSAIVVRGAGADTAVSVLVDLAGVASGGAVRIGQAPHAPAVGSVAHHGTAAVL